MLLTFVTACADLTTTDRPHRLAGQTLLDGVAKPRRVEVRDRRTGNYVISCVTGDDGVFEFTHLPEQILRDPYYVICFDDRDAEYGNALIYDRVYQVDDAGIPPQS